MLFHVYVYDIIGWPAPSAGRAASAIWYCYYYHYYMYICIYIYIYIRTYILSWTHWFDYYRYQATAAAASGASAESPSRHRTSFSNNTTNHINNSNSNSINNKHNDNSNTNHTKKAVMVGNPHRAQICQFGFFELIFLFKLDKQFPVERFEATASQSTIPSLPSYWYQSVANSVSYDQAVGLPYAIQH